MDAPWNQAHWDAYMHQAAAAIHPSIPSTQAEPQWQSHSMLPPAGKQNGARKYTRKDWDAQRPEIARLYEDNTLETVMEFMRENHGLEATPKQYKDRIKKWNLDKKIKTNEMEAIIRKQQQRALEYKQSAFRVRNRPVSQEKINRYIKEHPRSPLGMSEDMNMDGNTVSGVTPGAISCYTPSDTGPLTPHAASSPRTRSNSRGTANPQSSLSHRSLYSGSCQSGNPASAIPGSPFVAEMPGEFHIQPSSPIEIASSPTLSALIGFSEDKFTGRSPVSLSAPPTPQQQDHYIIQDGKMDFMYDGNGYLAELQISDLFDCATPSPSSELFPGTSPLRNHYWIESVVPGTASGVTVPPSIVPFSEVYAMVLSVNDALVIDKYHTALNPLDSLEGRHELATELCSQGRYETAEQVLQHVLQLRQGQLGLKHPDALKSMHALATALRYQGKYKTAEQMHRQTLQLRQELLTSDHPDTLKSMHELATTLRYQGKYKTAEQMHRQTLQLRQESLTPDHPDTLRSMKELAVTLSCQGRYNAAEQMHQRTLQLRKEALGTDHPDTLESIQELGYVFSCQSRHNTAVQMIELSLNGYEKVLGKEHPRTLVSVRYLSYVRHHRRENKIAEALCRRALDGNEKLLGAGHYDTLCNIVWLAFLLMHQGNHNVAEEMYRQALGRIENSLGNEHPIAFHALQGLAFTLCCQGKYQTAEELSRHALRGSEKVLGKEHPDTLITAHNLALILKCQGNYKAAEEIFRRELNGNDKVLGKEHYNTLKALDCLASVLQAQGNYKAAEEVYQRDMPARNIFESSRPRNSLQV